MEVLEQSKTSEIAVIANKIDAGLQAFEQRKSELIELEKEAHGLTIESIEDKVSITAVSTVRKKLKVARVEIEKEGKMMRDPLTNISRIISSKEKELIAIIEPTEKELLAKEKWVEDEKERIRIEAEEKEQQRIQARIDRLAEYGFQIDLSFIQTISDEDFEKVVENAKKQFELEQQRKAEEERLAKEEAEKLKAEREELERLRAQQAEAQRIIDEQNRKIKEEEEKQAAERERLRKQMIKNRIDQLIALGLTYNPIYNAYVFQDVNVDVLTELQIFDDKQWNVLIENIAPVIDQRKKEAEEKRQAEIKRLQEEAAAKALREKQEEEERQRQSEAERIAQSSDKVKFQTIVAQLQNISVPEMKSKKAKTLAANVETLIAKVIDHINTNM